MRNRRLVLLTSTICLLSCWMILQLRSDQRVAHAQQSAAATPSDPSVIHVETR